MNEPPRRRCLLPLLLVGYGVLVAMVVGAMVFARQATIAKQEAAGPEWQAWREDEIARQSQHGPVERRVPKSTEPPAVVLMRDNFAVLMAGALLFSSVLYWIMVWFVVGILFQRQPSN
jgi:hypothetical protein